MSKSNVYSRQARTMNPRVTPQRSRTPGKTEVQNNAGGFVFQITPWEHLKRFLILGSEGGTFYVGEQKLTRENAKNVESCIKENGRKVVDIVVEISDSGRASKNDAALFVLAMCAGLGTEEVRKYALENLPKVARIGTHLFHFADYVQQFRGWGHGLRKAVANWYTGKATDKLAYQLVKYQSRDGWSHRDLIRLSHPHVTDKETNTALHWAVKGVINVPTPMPAHDPLAVIYAFERVKLATDEKEIIKLVTEYHLPLEAIPTEKQTAKVLATAIPNLGITALIRNLGRYTKEGILTSTSSETKMILERLGDIEELRKGRVHPLNVLFALNTYKEGHGFRGSLTWTPVSRIVDALDEAFYLSFGAVTPTGKRILIGLDLSGSMGGAMIAGTNISARVASCAMSMVTARVESDYHIVGFTSTGGYDFMSRGNAKSSQTYSSKNGNNWNASNGLTVLDISPRRRLDDICKYTEALPMGGTDCALPMMYALDNKMKFDAFIVYTDSETWAGDIKPFQALKMYRDAMGIPARLIVVGMTATDFSIADPNDAGMLDVVGFDTAAPNFMSDFIRGEL